MILVDTSVWIDHFRASDPGLVRLLNAAQVATHPFIVGEFAMGAFAQRALVLRKLLSLPQATVATNAEALTFIDRHKLHGTGLSYIDAHLLAAVSLTPGTGLWTRDKGLAKIAARIRLPTV